MALALKQFLFLMDLWWLYIGAAMLIKLLNKILDKLRRMQFLVLVHEEVTSFQPFTHPFFYTLNPVIYPGIVGRVPAIAYKTNETLGCGKMHMHTVAAAGSIGNDSAPFMFAQEFKKRRVVALFSRLPFFIPLLQDQGHA